MSDQWFVPIHSRQVLSIAQYRADLSVSRAPGAILAAGGRSVIVVGGAVSFALVVLRISSLSCSMDPEEVQEGRGP